MIPCYAPNTQQEHGSFLAGVAQLPRLMSLTLQRDWRGEAKLLQQLTAGPIAGLMHMGVFVANTDKCPRLPPLNMASLTQLKELRLDAKFDAEFENGTELPAQLQRLHLTFSGTGRHSGLPPVLQLQRSCGRDMCACPCWKMH
jgi:hypothetical protein